MIPALIALFIIMSGGGSAPFADLLKQFSSASKDAIVATDRRDAAREVLKQMEKAIKSHEQSRDASIKALTDLGENHAATEAQYRAIFDTRHAGDAAFQAEIISLYAELKTHVTAQEWAAIVAEGK
jgi:hypothetical protein